MWIRTAVPAIEPMFTDQDMTILRPTCCSP